MSDQSGHYFILVGPSGAGKSTLLAKVLNEVQGLSQMATGTTRPRRTDETEGLQHLFFSDEEFDECIRNGAFVEWQTVHGKRYGTLKSVVSDGIQSGRDFLADVEVLGASFLKGMYPENVTLVFVLPSSMKALEERIRHRASESEEDVALRLARAQFELTFLPKCDYVLTNDDLDVALEQLRGIILAERSRRTLAMLRAAKGYPQHIFHYTATGVVFDRAYARILLVRRYGGPRDGWLYPPGGHVERGEYPHEALVREVREETGHQVAIAMQADNTGEQFDSALMMPKPYWLLLETIEHHFHYDFVYVCTVVDQILDAIPDSDWEWFSVDDVDAIPTLADVRALVHEVVGINNRGPRQ